MQSVVAVHGLGANPNYAWTWRGEEKPDGAPRETANWLTEFLPEELPNARIMTYGYDSRWHRNAPVITMFDIANSFMKNLDDQRTVNRLLSLVYILLNTLRETHKSAPLSLSVIA